MRISDWSSDVCSSDLVQCRTTKHLRVLVDLQKFGVRVVPADAVTNQTCELPQDGEQHFTAPQRSPLRLTRPARTPIRRIPSPTRPLEIGRASCRERVWQYV